MRRFGARRATEKIKRIRARVCPCATHLFILKIDRPRLFVTCSQLRNPSDLREIMWVTTCRIPLITPFFPSLSTRLLYIKEKRIPIYILRRMFEILSNDFQSSRSILRFGLLAGRQSVRTPHFIVIEISDVECKRLIHVGIQTKTS